jgi:hypothetical protein
MAGFLYFLEGARENQARDILPKRGLGHVVSDRLAKRGTNTGPGGRPGLVVADSRRVTAGKVGFWPETQTWRKVPGHEDAWVGAVDGELPGPEDLARPAMVAGEDVELGDGRLWHVPHAIDYEGPGLDRVMELGEDGRWRPGEVVAPLKPLWDLAWEWRDAIDGLTAYGAEHADESGQPVFDGFEDERLEADWLLDKSVFVLQTNYVIGRVEAAMLGLFVSGRRWSVLHALCDAGGLKRIVEAAQSEQKKTDGTPGTSAG